MNKVTFGEWPVCTTEQLQINETQMRFEANFWRNVDWFINERLCYREVNEDNMVFRNISAEFMEDAMILVRIELEFQNPFVISLFSQ